MIIIIIIIIMAIVMAVIMIIIIIAVVHILERVNKFSFRSGRDSEKF